MVYKIGQQAAKSVLRNPAFITSFTLTKQAAGDYDDNHAYVPGAETVTPDLEGNIQPLDGKQRLELPEGERLMDAICLLYETTDSDFIASLRIGNEQTDSDIITYNALQWAVRVVHDMSDFGHVEVYATRLERQNG